MKNIRNSSIDIFRLLCACLVVAIHTRPFMDTNYYLGYTMTEIIPRIAVPFFFLTSGYFYINKLKNNVKPFKSTMFNLLGTYSIWSLIYYLLDFISRVKNQENISGLIQDYIIKFFITGSYFQFWFFPALFFAIITVTIAHKVHLLKPIAISSILLYIIGVLGCSYYEIGIKVPILSQIIQYGRFNLIRRVLLMEFPFFMLGYFIPIISKKVKITLIHIIMTICIFFLEIIMVRNYHLQNNITITIGLYLLLICVFCYLLQNPLPQYSKLAKPCRELANFIFYVHPINILLIQHFIKVSNIWLYLTVLFLSMIEGIIIYYISISKNKGQGIKDKLMKVEKL